MLNTAQSEKTDDIFSENSFSQIRDIIYKESGISIPDEKKYFFERKITERLEACNLKTFQAYISYIQDKTDSQGKDEFSVLISAITVNETSFFRNEAQLRVFIREVIPEIVKNKHANGAKELRVWSAACSTGEEPYTLAIMLEEDFNFKCNGITATIFASDIDNAVIKKAKFGIYDNNSLRRVSAYYLKKYFNVVENNSFALNDKIKSMVTFKKRNLLDTADLLFIKNFDIIFCRNVIIYFDDEAKKKVIKNLRKSLNSRGYLFLGHSESLYTISDDFNLLSFKKTHIYQRAS